MTTEIAQAIAKVVAFQNCNRPKQAEDWFRLLARLLGLEYLLK